MTQRLQDWQVRFESCLAERWARPFAWGRQDCCLFAADCVEAITGQDWAATFRGRYIAKMGAYRLLIAAGGMQVVAAAALGDEIPVLMAQVGDIGMVEDIGQALVVCAGGHWLGAGADGVEHVPTSRVVRAWRVCS
jgi:hypothetical protein